MMELDTNSDDNNDEEKRDSTSTDENHQTECWVKHLTFVEKPDIKKRLFY